MNSHDTQPPLSSESTALARVEAITALALAALDGVSRSELRGQALILLKRHLGNVAEVTVQAATAGTWGDRVTPPGTVVPLGDCKDADVRIEVRCSPLDPLPPADVAFVEAVARVLDRAEAYRSTTQVLVQRASHDHLTGALNRAALDEALQARLSDGINVAALVCELDGLSGVNGRFGHRAGDKVLVISAARIRKATRETDLVARTGGDDFVVVCPGISLPDAKSVADRIGRAVAAPIPFADHHLEIGVQIGIATSNDRSGTIDLRNPVHVSSYPTEERRRNKVPPQAGQAEHGRHGFER